MPDGVETTRGVDQQADGDAVSLPQECVRLGDRCLDTTLEIFEDGPGWALRRNRGSGVEIERVADVGTGRLGVGVFTAGLARVTDKRRFREFTHRLLSPVVDDPTTAAPSPGVTAYYLATVGELTGDDQYLRAAQEVLQVMPGGDLSAGGLSGRVLGNLKLSKVSGDREPTDAIDRCEELLRRRRQTVVDSYTWSPPTSRPQTPGLGSDVGVAYALARLDRTTDRDLRPVVQASRPLAGAPPYSVVDIVPQIPRRNHNPVSRLALLATTGAYDRVRDIAAESCRRSLGEVDTLVTGNCRRIDTLVQAGRVLGESSYLAEAADTASRLVSRRSKTYSVPWNTSEWVNPTVQHGIAGVGYTFLRVLDPRLPSLLAWE